MSTREDTLARMDAQLDRWGKKLDALVARADTFNAEAQNEGHLAVVELGRQYEIAQKCMVDLRVIGADQWDSFLEAASAGWKEISAAFEEVRHDPEQIAP